MHSAPKSSSSTTDTGGAAADHGGEEGKSKDPVSSKMVGVLVFLGIAASIVKALIARPTNQPQIPERPRGDFSKPSVDEGTERRSIKARAVEIAKGDTLWSLSKTYGVSIDAIKEANGITGNTIYAGKKLVIP